MKTYKDYTHDAYGIDDVLSLIELLEDSKSFLYDIGIPDEIEMDYGDGAKLASALPGTYYDAEDEMWYFKNYSWTDCYFYPYNMRKN